MWKPLLIALFALLSSLPAAAAAQSATLGEVLCTTDSIAIAPLADNLREGAHTVSLNWNVAAGALWYRVYRGTASGGPYSMIADCVAGTSYVDVVAPSQILYYVVTAVNGLGSSPNSNQPTAPVPVFDTLADSIADAISVQIGETLSVSDTLTPTSTQQLALAETLSTSDSLVAHVSHSRTLNETLVTSDAIVPTAAFNVTLGETLSTTDSLSDTFRKTVSLGEALTTADALNRSFAGVVNLTETLSTTDSIAATATTRAASPVESLATSDAFSATGTFVYGLSESLITLDALTLTVTLPGTASNGTAIYYFGSYGIAPTGACGFTLQIFGNGFSSSSVVTWNGALRPTTFISAKALQVTLSNGDVAAAGSYPVIVWLGSYATPARYFAVIPASPTIAAARLSGGALIVDGANFAPSYGAAPGIISAGTTVFWNGQPLTTAWISPTRLQAQIPPRVGAIGNVAITVADTGCFSNR